ncbi:iron ABC transporter permease [Geomicrobium sp. JCM 19055]|uniref:ABC transporter permease n=1 Tax=Geomicrobium sp. JCM 19055 TaxID=1460649 RepID=UPI00045ED5F2|nr:ferric iron ABC transporter, permease protein [Geomicrobium sp. JCM 19055]
MKLKRLWMNIWKGNPPGKFLLGISSLAAILLAIPVLYVVLRSLTAGADRWARLLDGRIPELLWNTLSVTFAVTVSTIIIGVGAAWLVERTQLPWKKWWRWILAIPLVIPPYIGAVAFIILLGPRGSLARTWRESEWLSSFGEFPIDIYSFTGVWLVLTLFTYPYVFLICSSALRRISRSYEEVARSQGLGTLKIFARVYLPFLRPAIGAGALLVSLYVITDFGAIAMLRYLTFTSAIYYNMGSYDHVSATVLSTVLFAITLIILWMNSRFSKKHNVVQNSRSQPNEPLSLGKWKWPAFSALVLLFFLSVLLPVIVMVYWSIIGVQAGAIDARFIEYSVNTLMVAGMAAGIAIVVALPILYIKSRHPSVISTSIDRLAYAGYALPGVIVALGVIFFFNSYVPALYNTIFLVALAYVIRFLPQVLQSGEASLQLVSPKLDEAARSLGLKPWQVVIRVILPSIRSGILAGGALVFVSAVKELPATLLLRPPGFETLATRIWVETSEDLYYMAAPAALIIILVSILPLKYLLNKY